MTGYNLILKIKRIEQEAQELGFVLAHTRHNYAHEFGQVIALLPRDDCLPMFSRDAEIFIGTLEQIEDFLKGI